MEVPVADALLNWLIEPQHRQEAAPTADTGVVVEKDDLVHTTPVSSGLHTLLLM